MPPAPGPEAPGLVPTKTSGPFGYGAYEPPPSKRGRPAVILWYRTYCTACAVFYGGALSLATWTSAAHTAQGRAVVAIVLVLMLLHVVGAAVPFKPWGWTVGLIVLCLGLPTCVLPLAFALSVYWRAPTVKAAFRRM